VGPRAGLEDVVLSKGVQKSGLHPDHSPVSRTKVWKAWGFTFMSSVDLHDAVLMRRDNYRTVFKCNMFLVMAIVVLLAEPHRGDI
jgi:hypothetical protein